MEKTPMPITKLVGSIDERCTDYADGDDPGFFEISYSPDTGELSIFYEPDNDQNGSEFEARHLRTMYLFTARTQTGLGWPEVRR